MRAGPGPAPRPGRRGEGDEHRPPLFAEAEAGDQFAITVDVAIVEVAEVAAATQKLLDALVTAAPAKDREVEAAKARERAAIRYGRP